MAFVLHQTWDASTRSWGVGEGLSARPGVLAPLLANGRDRYFRKTGATILSVIVHILLIWLFLNKLAGNVGAGDGNGAGDGTLMQFSLSDPAAASVSASTEQRQIQELVQAARATSEVETTVATELPPPEWSVSRLPPAAQPQRPESAAAAGTATASAGTGGAGAGAGRGGSEIYDPFAGAAPLRREREEQAAARSLGERVLGFLGFGPAATGSLTLDEATLEAIRRAVIRSLPGRRGTAELVVRVSPTGVVLEVSPRGGSAPPEAKDALARALVGKRLYRGNAVEPQTLALPILSFG